MEPKLVSPPKPTRTVLVSGPVMLYTPPPTFTGTSYTPPSNLINHLRPASNLINPLRPASNMINPLRPLRPITRETGLRGPLTTQVTLSNAMDASVETDPEVVPSTSSRSPPQDNNNLSRGTPNLETRHTPSLERTPKLESRHSPSLESTLAEHALLSLPEVCDQVVSQQIDQSQELQCLKVVLSEREQSLREKRDVCEGLQSGVSRLLNGIHVFEAELNVKSSSNKKLYSELLRLVSDNTDLCQTIQHQQNELTTQKLMFDKYQDKIKQHIEVVKDLEHNSVMYKHLKKQQDKVDALLNKKIKLEQTGGHDIIRSLQQRIHAHKQHLQTLHREKQQVLDSSEQRDQEHTSLKQSLDVLNKRNVAQMTRLRKCLKEVQARNRHWQEQIVQLQSNIESLNKTLYQS